MINVKDKYSMSLDDNIFYAKRNIIDTIYSEAKLEGIGVTYPDIYEIYEGRTVSDLSLDETLKINNLKHAWQFILGNLDYPIDLRFIRQVNNEIGQRVVMNSGNLRTLDVKIGGTNWRPVIPNEDDVKKSLDSILCSNSTTTEKAINLMLYIMRSQLFMDGNKRTAQIVANKVMISSGVGIICIPVDKQSNFIELLIEYYESNNSDVISNFIYDYCIDGFNSPKFNGSEETNLF